MLINASLQRLSFQMIENQKALWPKNKNKNFKIWRLWIHNQRRAAYKLLNQCAECGLTLPSRWSLELHRKANLCNNYGKSGTCKHMKNGDIYYVCGLDFQMELTFWENVQPTPCDKCHLSRATCHVSYFSNIIFFLIRKLNNKKKLWTKK